MVASPRKMSLKNRTLHYLKYYDYSVLKIYAMGKVLLNWIDTNGVGVKNQVTENELFTAEGLHNLKFCFVLGKIYLTFIIQKSFEKVF